MTDLILIVFGVMQKYCKTKPCGDDRSIGDDTNWRNNRERTSM